jgi:hypothetical protein
MPLSQFTSATIDEDGTIRVNGPFLAQGEDVDVTCLHFILTQGDEFAAGTGNVDAGVTAWDGTIELANNLAAGRPTVATAVAVLFARVDTSAGKRSGPQVYTWAGPIKLEAAS